MRLFPLALRLSIVPGLLLAAGVLAQGGRTPAGDAKPPGTGRTPPPAAATPPDSGRTPPASGTRGDTGHTPPATGTRGGGGRSAPEAEKTRPDTGHFPPGSRGAPAQPAAPTKAVKVKPTLVCTTATVNGKPLKLPGSKVRLEAPIQCVLSAGPNTGGAALKGTIRTLEAGKVRKSHEGPLSGAGNAAMQQDLQNGEDYETCMNFTIEAEIRDQSGKVVGKKNLKIKQFCPD